MNGNIVLIVMKIMTIMKFRIMIKMATSISKMWYVLSYLKGSVYKIISLAYNGKMLKFLLKNTKQTNICLISNSH